MTKRGKVLRDPHVGPGLLMVEGQQHRFLLDDIWKSDVPAKPGLMVDVEFDPQGKLTGITAVPEGQVAKDQAEIALAAAKKRGAAVASSMVAKFGLPQLVAAGVLIFSWSLLTAVSAQLPFPGKLEFTFWQLLGYLNSDNLSQALERHGNPSSGFYGFLALVAVCGPFLHHLWKDKRAALGGLLPLAFMLGVGILARSHVQNSFPGPSDGLYGDLHRQGQEEMMRAISLGFGTYVSTLVSLYFAALGVKQFFTAKRSDPKVFENARRVAA